MYNNGEFAEPLPSFPQPVVPPDVDPDAGGLLTVMYSLAWLQVLQGAVLQLLQSTTWDVTSESDRELAQDRAMRLLNILAGSAAAFPGIDADRTTLTRFNTMTGDTEISYDGGTTYTDAPGLNPQTQKTFPPLTTADPKCDGASNLTRYISDFMSATTNNISLGGDAAGVGAFIIGLLLELGPFGILLDLAVFLGTGLLSIGATAISAALPSSVYDQLTCIFLDHIDSSGQFDATSESAVESDISAQFGLTAATVLNGVISLMGFGGMSNASVKGHLTGSCTYCTEWCYEFDFSLSDGGWSIVSIGAYTPGVGFTDTYGVFAPNGYRGVDANITFTSTEITYARMEYTYSQTLDNCPGEFTVGLWTGAFATLLFGSENFATPLTSPQEWTGSEVTTEIVFQLQCGCNVGNTADPGGSTTCLKVKLRGTGANPFGSDNC